MISHLAALFPRHQLDAVLWLPQVMMKSADGVSLEERCQTHSLAQACVLFSQGIAFLHAGDELLRSKSLDRDGYNSGGPPHLLIIRMPFCWQPILHTT